MIEQEKVAKEIIQGRGFDHLTGLISEQQAAEVRQEVLDRLDEGSPAGEGVVGLADLINWGPRFEALATQPRLLSLARHLLGDDATLGALSARVLMPGCEPGRLHVDYPYWAMNYGMPVEPALMMQVIWMMEPFTEENGGTWIAPASQGWNARPNTERFSKSAIQATGETGDAIVSHGLLWHQTAKNLSDKPRVAILINYTQLAVRPLVEMGPFSEEFKATASEDLAKVLNFDFTASLRNRLIANGKLQS